MDLRTYVAARVDPTPLSAGLAVGDVLAIGAFVVAGEIRHGTDPVANPLLVADTLAPFLLGWALAALLGGLYTTDALKNPRRVLSWTVPAWVLATLVGHGLRATELFHGGTTLGFIAVTLGLGGALVVGWRLLVAALLARE